MLHTDERKPRTKLNAVRKSGKIPAIMYGHGVESLAVVIDKNEFVRVLKEKGEGALIDLEIKGQQTYKVLIYETQRDPLNQEIIHLDFYRVKMDEKLRTDIRVNFVGEAPGVKAGGILIKDRDHIQIECLPKDLIQEIQVDLLLLTDIHSSVKISDLSIPDGVVVLEDAHLILASIAAVQKEKEVIESDEEEKEKEKAQIAKLESKPEEEAAKKVAKKEKQSDKSDKSR